MIVNIILLVGFFIYVIIRDRVFRRKMDRDTLLKKRISGKLDRLEAKVDRQSGLFEKLLTILGGE